MQLQHLNDGTIGPNCRCGDASLSVAIEIDQSAITTTTATADIVPPCCRHCACGYSDVFLQLKSQHTTHPTHKQIGPDRSVESYTVDVRCRSKRCSIYGYVLNDFTVQIWIHSLIRLIISCTQDRGIVCLVHETCV